jgi:chemotaxis-related protein WspB
MLFLVFQLGPDRYALDARRVTEVLPLVDIKTIPHAPYGIAGVFNYRGTPVPVIDLTQLTLGQPARRCLSTRIVLVHDTSEWGEQRVLGLMAEHATETVRREPSDFVPTGVANGAAPYLGPVATDARGLMQWIEMDTLLPAPVKDALFSEVLDQ